MKAILVIDMPNNCYECPCFMDEGWRCQNKLEIDEDVNDGRPDWCPLKPVPKKYEAPEIYELWNTDSEYFNGWNDCLDSITGETE